MKKNECTSLKTALLTPQPVVSEAVLLGTPVWLRRMTAAELIGHEEAMAAAQVEGDPRKASEISIQIIIDSLVQPDGTLIPVEDKPTAAELLAVHDNVVLLEAVGIVKRHAIGRLEDAEKN
ncbi:phage tail protein [Shimwellia blattae]|uniref:Phage tail protein n=1 Tax=Shimwellia blattae (strain ATCC 29907 / DSM 4481 / JCM 1650 / NBRC 105725 / CDC 9005-74) TaxID=630626 RepID=I2B9D8_SHIBC|nr:phage tail protein [Shimwellia blattae]AFJ47142.1 hypothetical protein EBL_c20510 [Shimwellia blattae DSM 4481 = NBRC 105725]GAB80738.1 hypothetical protein EB105725_08_00230 [Shimwellia blattae DSM 4481 = NBRC 105725]VDY64634.1 Uncharacterised protein [Shimwellia blattae]VEC22741.1 Uncharacterised protein [Shimwellia blattae]